ncbi:hypothetical protein [Mesorhizobium sp.]|uniref:hypothetical protein n=1 Tax=Mesorhizobium sp. TaxID=1871066 RepID=UPI0025FD6F98|nr:hypothetical protein [Mesorhizobium sp.]
MEQLTGIAGIMMHPPSIANADATPLCHSPNDPERPSRMSDCGHESKARVIFEPVSLSHIKKQDPLLGLVCVRRNPAATILAAKPGFRMFLEVLNRIFGVHISRFRVHGHLLFSSFVCDRPGSEPKPYRPG